MSARGKITVFALIVALFFGSLAMYMHAWVHLHPDQVIISGGCGAIPPTLITPEVTDRGRHEANLAGGMVLMLLSGVGVVGGAVGLGEDEGKRRD